MRNPIRPKNLSLRFVPLYLAGGALLILFPPAAERFVWALPPIVLGVLLRGWGAGHLVKNHELTISGPYAHLRHPLYLGTLLVGTGFGLLVGGWMALVVLACLWPWFALRYFPRKDRSESARLESLYGERFARYRAAVPALRPRLGPWREAGAKASAREWALERYSDNNELGTLLAITGGVLVFWLRCRWGPI